MSRIGWLDCSSGVSGDMLLAALAAVGVDQVRPAIDALAVTATVETTRVTRGGLAATQVTVKSPDEQPARTWAEVRSVLTDAALPADVRARAVAVFTRLAAAEASVHGLEPDTVHFHEIGAVDALVDVVGVCWGFAQLRLERLVVSPIALGSGTADTLHGTVPVPAPAVLQLLAAAGLPALSGQHAVETCTPTGAALVAEWAESTGGLPEMTIERVGVGAGAREIDGRPNVVRLVVGTTADQEPGHSPQLVIEANVDDLDPRIWPSVLQRLLAAGAADAWLTPILMKKGRPAHTVAALVDMARADGVRRVLFTETTTIGLREHAVEKTALDRHTLTVDVDGCTVRAKVSQLGGSVVSVTPEWDDVEAAAATLGRPAKAVLAAASRAAEAAVAQISGV